MSLTRIQPKQHNAYVIAPTNMAEAMEYSKMIASSCFCPTNMRNKPGDVLVAVQMGAEIGLSPIQALQNIAVINARPVIWGDATVAVVQGHPCYVRHDEWTEGTLEKGDMVAFCSITRKNADAHVRSFSVDDAKRAKLWGKPGPWVQYPARMLQMRARAFAFRDKFSDALKGIQFREEVEDYEVVSRAPRKPVRVPAVVVNNVDALKPVYEGFMNEITAARNELVLKQIWDKVKGVEWIGTDYLQRLIDVKDCMKALIKGEDAECVQTAQADEIANDEHTDFITAMDGEVTE